mmetsp:Transcript_37402/g.48394  ORF Transcript_37402/g.48394 Transcript_37402/m.48394 type:complete len:97 (-) Transcript_37402:1028-1318(-)
MAKGNGETGNPLREWAASEDTVRRSKEPNWCEAAMLVGTYMRRVPIPRDTWTDTMPSIPIKCARALGGRAVQRAPLPRAAANVPTTAVVEARAKQR